MRKERAFSSFNIAVIVVKIFIKVLNRILNEWLDGLSKQNSLIVLSKVEIL